MINKRNILQIYKLLFQRSYNFRNPYSWFLFVSSLIKGKEVQRWAQASTQALGAMGFDLLERRAFFGYSLRMTAGDAPSSK